MDHFERDVTRIVPQDVRAVRELLDTEIPHGTYLGVWCATCRCDVLPMRNGCCGWCDRRLPRAA
jgi:hypothetical protein